MKNCFHLLLKLLDSDDEKAAEKYLLLQRKIIKIVIWKKYTQTEAEEIADIVIDRIAQKIEKGEEIEDVNKFANVVLNYVLLEHNRKRKEDAVGDDLPESPVLPDFKEKSLREHCLEKCLEDIITDEKDRYLIVRYYDVDDNESNKDNRKILAEELELTGNNLKVKASRIRSRLEKCINECVEKLSVTKRANSDTYTQGGEKR